MVRHEHSNLKNLAEFCSRSHGEDATSNERNYDLTLQAVGRTGSSLNLSQFLFEERFVGGLVVLSIFAMSISQAPRRILLTVHDGVNQTSAQIKRI